MANTNAPTQEHMDLILNLPVTLSVQLGSTKLSIKQLVQSSPGTVFELTKKSSQPLDILVNGSLIAKGEAVIVNDKVGIRITKILEPGQRLSRIKKA